MVRLLDYHAMHVRPLTIKVTETQAGDDTAVALTLCECKDVIKWAAQFWAASMGRLGMIDAGFIQ